MKPTWKSRSNSAFFVFVRSLLFAILWAAVVLLMEIVILKLWVLFPKSLLHAQLWWLPGMAFVFSFFWSLWDSGLYRTVLVLLVIALAVSLVRFYSDEVMDVTTRYLMDIRLSMEKIKQKQSPVYEEAMLLETDPFPIYYVHTQEDQEALSDYKLQYLVSFIQELPDVLQENTAALYLVDDTDFWEHNEDLDSSNIFGITETSSFSASIRMVNEGGSHLYTAMHSGAMVSLDNPVFYTETIVHELCHLLDVGNLKNGELYSSSSEIAGFYQENPDLFGSYGSSSPAEYFAEAGTYYFLYPQKLQELSPDLYNLFEIKFGQEKTISWLFFMTA